MELIMQIIINETKASIMINNIEVGYATLEGDEVIDIKEVYVYPGYRNHRYAYTLVDGIIKEAIKEKKDIKSNCWYVIKVIDEYNKK
jgi:hypothetical protein